MTSRRITSRDERTYVEAVGSDRRIERECVRSRERVDVVSAASLIESHGVSGGAPDGRRRVALRQDSHVPVLRSYALHAVLDVSPARRGSVLFRSRAASSVSLKGLGRATSRCRSLQGSHVVRPTPNELSVAECGTREVQTF